MRIPMLKEFAARVADLLGSLTPSLSCQRHTTLTIPEERKLGLAACDKWSRFVSSSGLLVQHYMICDGHDLQSKGAGSNVKPSRVFPRWGRRFRGAVGAIRHEMWQGLSSGSGTVFRAFTANTPAQELAALRSALLAAGGQAPQEL